MTLIKNDQELLVKMATDIAPIINEATEILLEKLKKKIGTEVYNKREPKKYVRRKENGGLLGSWKKSNVTVSNWRGERTVSATVYSDPQSMEINSDDFVHGSNYWIVHDIRLLLNDFVIRGKSGPMFDKERTKGRDDGIPGWWRSPRDFYHPIVELMNSGWMANKIAMLFRKHGIKGRMIKG